MNLINPVRTFYCLSVFLSLTATGQDTLKLNLREADSLFVSRNLHLLASTLNIEARKAQVIQAKLYPNPVFTADLNVYDPENRKPFHIGQTGQKTFQLEQLILLGGKRQPEIEMARSHAKIAELEFQQLLRRLKFRLHSDLYSIGQLSVLLDRYNQQLVLLETLLSSHESQVPKGNIPLKDVVRLKGAYLKLNKERAALLKEYFETQGSLRTLLQTTSIVAFEFSENDIERYIRQKSLDDIKTEADQHRPELQIIRANRTLAAQYLEYQKRQAVPDISLFSTYDQRGGAFNNQVNAGFAIGIPLWNRNQGNIRASQYKLREAELNLQATEAEMYNELHNAYSLYTQTVSEYRKAIALYNSDFETTVTGMILNFRKRNVSIIEFVDFFETYNEVLNELTRIKTLLVISAEQINLLTGKDIY